MTLTFIEAIICSVSACTSFPASWIEIAHLKWGFGGHYTTIRLCGAMGQVGTTGDFGERGRSDGELGSLLACQQVMKYAGFDCSHDHTPISAALRGVDAQEVEVNARGADKPVVINVGKTFLHS